MGIEEVPQGGVAAEQMDFGFRSREQVERYTRHAALGLVPILRGTSAIGKKPHDYILEKPTSAYAESIRSLHTSLLLSDIKKRPGIVLFSSAMPNEGKTAVAVSLGRMLASLGQRVLLIDCDLRRPSLHQVFGVSDQPGLTSGFVPEKIADDLDFIAVHIYPEQGKLDEALRTLEAEAFLQPEHVLALAEMIMRAGLKVNLRVYIPAVENAIAGNAYRPSDIVTTRQKPFRRYWSITPGVRVAA
jgi:hypothetical protein